jgi:hypothetical protein
MPAPYSVTFDTVSSPARQWQAVTPADGATAQFPITPKSIYVGGAGNIVLRDAIGTNVTFTVVAGSFLPLCATRVQATGTNATGIVALF